MSVRRPFEPLTRRQRQVLDLLVRGRTNYEIAQHLGISLDGAKWHVREVLARLGVESREQAAEVWRRERSWWSRGTAPFVGLFAGAAARGAVAAVVALVVASVVGAAIYLRGDDDSPAAPDSTPTPDPAATPTTLPGADDLSPRSGIPIVDEVIGIARRGDLPAFRSLMKKFPEPCTTGLRGVGSPPACPPGASNGTPVDTFRAIASERVDEGDLDQLLANVVPNLTTLHGVSTPQPDTFNGFFPAWKHEVFVYGAIGTSQTWAVYFLDDAGIVGMYASGALGVTARRDGVPPDDWLIAPYSLPRFAAEKDLYVIGRDSQITFVAELPPACVADPVAIRLYAYPAVGESGGIQVPSDRGLASEARSFGAGNSGTTIVTFKLPAALEGPIRLRPGLLSPCLSQVAVQGEINLALLARPEDEDIAILEVEGAMFDLVGQRGGIEGAQSAAEWMGGELTAAVDGYACATVSVVDSSARNARGNVEFRVGEASQPAPCRTPGSDIYFVMTARGDGTEALFGAFQHVPGTIQLVRNLGPEPPGSPRRLPLIR